MEIIRTKEFLIINGLTYRISELPGIDPQGYSSWKEYAPERYSPQEAKQ